MRELQAQLAALEIGPFSASRAHALRREAEKAGFLLLARQTAALASETRAAAAITHVRR
jgi:hypothetical protein